ncbi:MAG: hypothetical protein LBQ12_06240 [Deltaproteobacteria bacterium]|nr:hypothetical protein [Deltaproteobacteria bacterium]
MQKYILDSNLDAALELLGFPPGVAEACVQLSAELIRPNVAVRRPDYVLLMPDGTILIIEFQSSADVLDVVRFLEYASLAAVKYSKELKRLVPVSVIVIYTADVDEERLKLSFPGEGGNGRDASGGKKNYGTLSFEAIPVCLGKVIDAAKLLNEPKLLDADWDPNAGLDLDLGKGTVHLTLNALLGMLYFAPLALDRGPHLELGKKYFEVGRSISEKTGDKGIFRTMAISALSRRFASEQDINSLLKELTDMGTITAEAADILSGGVISRYREQLEAKDEQLEAKDEQLKQLEAQREQFANSIAKAVRRLNAEKKSPEEIGEFFNLSIKEVYRILGGD